MKIYHAADIHLGKQRLEGRLPDQDFAAAFRFIADEAMRDKADVLVLAGDLFDRPQVQPGHLRQAQEVLQVLYRAKIPVLAIEGNHDKANIHSEDPTWVGFLAEDGLLKLLRPQFGPEGALLRAYDEKTRRGSFIDYGGIRFVGAGYLGAATPAKVRQIADALETALPHVLILHAGPDYFVGEGGGFSKEDLAAIREKVCYLALGHIHKPMLHGGWACNPGSPENCDLRESAYNLAQDGSRVNRGYAVVEIDSAEPKLPLKLEIRSNPRRPVHRVELDCTPFGNKLKDANTAFIKAAVKQVTQTRPEPEAAVDLRLVGHMNLNRIALDYTETAASICREAGVFAVSLDASQLNLGQVASAGEALPSGLLSRDDLEKQALRKVVEQSSLSGVEDSGAVVNLFFELKQAVRSQLGAEGIAELIANSPLVEKIQAARQTPAPSRGMTPALPTPPAQVGI